MKKIMIVAISFLLLAACQKESISEKRPQAEAPSKMYLTRPISNRIQSDPDPNPRSVYGGSLFYGNMTHLGTVHGKVVNTSFTTISAGVFSITSEDIAYTLNGDELWTKGEIVISFPTDGSTIATITGGSTIVGGTGRFAGANGYFVYENMVYDIVTGHESHTSNGEINY
ncbi:MAG: hypothetical protein ABI761_06400 [Saprospiraceae bacterium]